MMQEVTSLDIIKDITIDTFYPSSNKRQATPVSDTIYTLDIETTNLFKINGKYRCFDKSIASYKDIEKVLYSVLTDDPENPYRDEDWEEGTEAMERLRNINDM